MVSQLSARIMGSGLLLAALSGSIGYTSYLEQESIGTLRRVEANANLPNLYEVLPDIKPDGRNILVIFTNKNCRAANDAEPYHKEIMARFGDKLRIIELEDEQKANALGGQGSPFYVFAEKNGEIQGRSMGLVSRNDRCIQDRFLTRTLKDMFPKLF